MRFFNLSAWSLSAKICATATVLAVIGLGVTAAVTGIQSKAIVEADVMERARMAAKLASAALRTRILSDFASLSTLVGSVESSFESNNNLSRMQLVAMSRQFMSRSDHLIGMTLAFEPNLFDGNDSKFAGQGPEYDSTGRYMPYFVKEANGEVRVEPIVFSDKTEENEWYNAPKRNKKVLFTEPFQYAIDGKQVLMASLVMPVQINGNFAATASADFPLSGLSKLLAELPAMENGSLALVSSGGVYASHQRKELIGAPAKDIPAEGLAAIRAGQEFEYTGADGMIHLLTPVNIHADIPPWSIQLSFPRDLAMMPAKALITNTGLASIISALIATIVLVSVLSRLLRPLRNLSHAMEGLADGSADLNARLPEVGNDELSRIAESFNLFVRKIQLAFDKVQEAATIVATASKEISQGNVSLSARTEQQASTIEETAASMEELTSTVAQNAERAQQAGALALDASTVASHSGRVVANIVEMMGQINNSSQRVKEITSVIDSIAFQTNILALNAAVEAARAGEEGRGFAVVASEIRNLAQRSAVAAGEIKVLIDQSVAQAESGACLVVDAGGTMDKVVNAVTTLAKIVDEISTASSEQATGIKQVNEAICALDGVTLQNSALVEEAAAATESLKEQASSLVQIIDDFCLQSIEMSQLANNTLAISTAPPMPLKKPGRDGSEVSSTTIVAQSPKTVELSDKQNRRVPQAAELGDDWESF